MHIKIKESIIGKRKRGLSSSPVKEITFTGRILDVRLVDHKKDTIFERAFNYKILFEGGFSFPFSSMESGIKWKKDIPVAVVVVEGPPFWCCNYCRK